MVTRSVIQSDISGEPNAATVMFGLAETWYEIDLTDEERKKLEQTLKAYVAKGRKASAVARVEKKRMVPETTSEERETIRAWARENGFEFADRGRIPKNVQKAYDEVHNIKR